ncbi:MAG: hypothetical protein WDO24_21535 [Pseudomonadota bacterium]
MPQRLFGLADIGGVADDKQQPGEVSCFIEARMADRMLPSDRAVGTYDPRVDLKIAALGDRGAPRHAVQAQIIGMNERDRLLAGEEFALRHPAQLEQGVRPVDPIARLVVNDRADPTQPLGFDQMPMALEQRRFGDLMIRDVAEGSDRPQRRAVGGVDDSASGFDPAPAAIDMTHAEQGRDIGFACRQQIRDVVLILHEVVGWISASNLVRSPFNTPSDSPRI